MVRSFDRQVAVFIDLKKCAKLAKSPPRPKNKVASSRFFAQKIRLSPLSPAHIIVPLTIHTLFDLNEHLRRIVALNFQQPLWIAAEIAQVGRSKGHYYLQLVQKGEGELLVAQSAAVLWAQDHRRLYRTLGSQLDAVLQEGLEVKMCVRVDFHEHYGLKLHITDLDPAHTLGQLERQRRQTIQTLQQLNLLERNGALALPTVLQRIAIISSEGAAGFQDFREQLQQNALGYRFHCQLFNASVQGKSAEAELLTSLTEVAAMADNFDCVVIIRGGGARLDLAAFDGLELSKYVAQMPLPVLTGIGHDVDETVLDLVAHTSLKTPTAVADFLIQHNLFFEGDLQHQAEQLALTSQYQLKINALELERLESGLRWGSRERLQNTARLLDQWEIEIPVLAVRFLRDQRQRLSQIEALCAALQPANVLRRGYSLTLKNGKTLTSASEVVPGDEIETRLREGVLRSTVTGDRKADKVS